MRVLFIESKSGRYSVKIAFYATSSITFFAESSGKKGTSIILI